MNCFGEIGEREGDKTMENNSYMKFELTCNQMWRKSFLRLSSHISTGWTQDSV